MLFARSSLNLQPFSYRSMTDATITEEEEARYLDLQLQALGFARKGETATLNKMLVAGLPVNLSDQKGNSLLMLASYHGNLETVEMLIRQGAEVDRRNDRGQTPLGGVAFKGDFDLARMLVDSGAEIDADNGGGKTPLMFAAMFGHREVVDFLLEEGANPKAKSYLGITAPQIAKVTGVARSLLERLK